MNNSIIIKGADFSLNKVGKLNIQKLTITTGGDGAKDVSDGSVIDVPSSGWYPAENMAYSAEISLPAGTKYLFGKISIITLKTTFDTYLSTPSQGQLSTDPAPVWLFHDATSGEWTHVMALENTIQTKPNLLGYKENLFDSGRFVVALFDGGIYGQPFQSTLNIDKIIVNWFRTDGAEAPEIGVVLPEVYACF